MIGKFDSRATLLRKLRSDDDGGGYAESWTAFAVVWAALEAAGGDDAFGPDAVEARVRYRIVLRRRSDVAAGQRVAIGTRTFDIVLVTDEGPRIPTITLLCEEVP